MSIVNYGVSKHYAGPMVSDRCPLGYLFLKCQHLNIESRDDKLYRRVAEIQIFEKTYLIVIKDETGLKFKMNDSTLFLIGSYAQKLVASY